MQISLLLTVAGSAIGFALPAFAVRRAGKEERGKQESSPRFRRRSL
jgi:hypothetical protein